MSTTLETLFKMFYPLGRAEQRRWGQVLSLPEEQYVSGLEAEARRLGLRQRVETGHVAWLDSADVPLLLLFRITDPRDLSSVRSVYDAIAESTAPLAYTFVNQIPDGDGTWDIFHMSRLTYLAHCNRVTGPGS